ncbi:hypothetical protein NPIL_415881, partial [Nephila pilipes]
MIEKIDEKVVHDEMRKGELAHHHLGWGCSLRLPVFGPELIFIVIGEIIQLVQMYACE